MQSTIINNEFVMSCPTSVLQAIARVIGVAEPQVTGKVKKLRAIVGTKLAQGETREAFDAGMLTAEMIGNAVVQALVEALAARMADDWDAAYAEEAQRKAAEPKAQAGKRANNKSAKDWLRELLSQADAKFTLGELVALSGKTEVNIRTMLSDLRSPKYCGKGGVFNTKSTRVDGKTYYSAA